MVIATALFAAPVEQVVSFQGKIVESGTPPTGTRNMEFKLYDVVTGGTALWTESHVAVPVTAGLFNVELGAATTFASAGVDFTEQYWVGISVAGGAEISPRYKLTGTPYAMSDGDWIVDGTNMYSGVTGNVGIGTDSPVKELHVDGSALISSHGDNHGVEISVVDAPLSISHNTLIGRTGGSGTGIFSGGGNLLLQPRGSMSGRGIYFLDGDGDINVCIKDGGDVGIGTTSPDAKLHAVDGDMNAYLCKDGTSDFSVEGNYNDLAIGYLGRYTPGMGTVVYYGVRGDAASSSTNYGVYGSATGGTKNWGGFFLGDGYFSGNVGIGTTTPTYKLEVVGNGMFTNTSCGTIARICNNVAGTPQRTYGVYGSAGHTSGTNYGVYGYAAGGDTDYGVYCAGNGAYTGSWTDVSDRKFKKNITPMTGILAKVLDLNPVTYEMRTEEYDFMGFSEGNEYGLIAQELKEVFPELVKHGVHPGDDENAPVEYEGIDYISLTSILVRGMQEQQVQIKELKAEIEALKNNQ